MKYDLSKFNRNGAIPNVGDILENVVPIKIEYTNSQEVFIYRPKIFPTQKGLFFLMMI